MLKPVVNSYCSPRGKPDACSRVVRHDASRKRASMCYATAAKQSASSDDGPSTFTGKAVNNVALLCRRQLLSTIAGSATLLAMPSPVLGDHQHTVVLPGALSGPDCRQGIAPAASTHVRKNIKSLKDAELQLLRKGVENMKKRPVEDITSWRFQANIHGIVPGADPINSPLWDQCKHTFNFQPDGLLTGKQFLAWHRGYLYFFERILAKAAGVEDGSLAVPYWDWVTDGVLPLPFRELKYTDANGETKDNPLWHQRPVTINDVANPASLDTNRLGQQVSAALQEEVFWTDKANYGFNTALERPPHNRIHSAVGGRFDMGDPGRSGRDPVFWVHHANVDRLWNVWLNDRRHNNLSDPTFLSTQYRFADADGTEVCVTISDIIDATKLGYQYSGTPNPVLERSRSGGRQPARRPFVEKPEEVQYEEVASSAPVRRPQEGASSIARLITPQALGFAPEAVQLYDAAGAPARAQATRSLAIKGSRWVVEIEGLAYEEVPDFGFDVFISKPGSDPASGVNLGSINFFSTPRGPGSTFAERFDATAAIKQLQLGEGADLPVVTLLPTTVLATAVGSAGEEQAAAINRAAEASVEIAKIQYRRINLLRLAAQ